MCQLFIIIGPKEELKEINPIAPSTPSSFALGFVFVGMRSSSLSNCINTTICDRNQFSVKSSFFFHLNSFNFAPNSMYF